MHCLLTVRSHICLQAQKPAGRRPDIHLWLMAWDAYALAAAALKQFTFYDACLHKRNVMRVALSLSKARSPLLGVLYDELARCVQWRARMPYCSMCALPA